MPPELASAVMAAVTRSVPNWARIAWTMFFSAAGPELSQLRPQAFGYSQSRSMPSKTSAQRGSSTRSWQDLAKAAGFFTASVKPPDQVQPPKDQRTLMCGYLALSLRSWLKLPRSGWSQVSATPSTDSAAVYALS